MPEFVLDFIVLHIKFFTRATLVLREILRLPTVGMDD